MLSKYAHDSSNTTIRITESLDQFPKICSIPTFILCSLLPWLWILVSKALWPCAVAIAAGKLSV